MITVMFNLAHAVCKFNQNISAVIHGDDLLMAYGLHHFQVKVTKLHLCRSTCICMYESFEETSYQQSSGPT